MEPDRPTLIHHALADGFHYFNDNLGRTLLTDGSPSAERALSSPISCPGH
jgi:hypothetical protein